MNYLFDNPYTYRRVKTPWFGSRKYEILFLDSPVRHLTANVDFMEEIVFLLNTAWNLRYGSGRVAGEISTSPREQKLIDIMFEIGIVAAKSCGSMDKEQVAKWIAKNLDDCGFYTEPRGMSWGVLCERPPKKDTGISIVEAQRPD